MVEQNDANGRYDQATCSILYKTNDGAFFVHAEESWTVVRDGETVERSRDSFEPLSREGARTWIMTGDVEILDDELLNDPPAKPIEPSPVRMVQ